MLDPKAAAPSGSQDRARRRRAGTGQCHYECDDDNYRADGDARVAALRVLADHMSRVLAEERRQRVRRLREVKHTSRVLAASPTKSRIIVTTRRTGSDLAFR